MLIASSPVEIEAKAGEAGLPQEAHDIALRLFHALTDRIGQVAAGLGTPHDEWPSHRFYFGEGGAMSALLDGLDGRADIVDVTGGVEGATGAPTGLYVRGGEGGFVGVLVAHENHEGYLSKTPRPGAAGPGRGISPV